MLVYIFGLMFVLTRFKTTILQTLFSSCVYPALVLVVKKAFLGMCSTPDFFNNYGNKGLGVYAASLEVSFNAIGCKSSNPTRNIGAPPPSPPATTCPNPPPLLPYSLDSLRSPPQA